MLFEIIQSQNRRPNNIQKTSKQSFKTPIKILACLGLAYGGWTQFLIPVFHSPFSLKSLDSLLAKNGSKQVNNTNFGFLIVKLTYVPSCTRMFKTWRICLDIELCQLKNGYSSQTRAGTPFSYDNYLVDKVWTKVCCRFFHRNYLTWVLLKKYLRIAGFFASIPFLLTYLSNKRLKPSIFCVQLWRKIAQTARTLTK